eukprot:TRINITY_DN4020_c0_g1_i1.p1 TRINITY_DN4020_c0_g1~~TRINITY_DN4020_c0_g1_i1.p1  ORF type:complete len:172 (-),score=30.42 TRINITY_DN4020_c0_g1_i1:445-960(-)
MIDYYYFLIFILVFVGFFLCLMRALRRRALEQQLIAQQYYVVDDQPPANYATFTPGSSPLPSGYPSFPPPPPGGVYYGPTSYPPIPPNGATSEVPQGYYTYGYPSVAPNYQPPLYSQVGEPNCPNSTNFSALSSSRHNSFDFLNTERIPMEQEQQSRAPFLSSLSLCDPFC